MQDYFKIATVVSTTPDGHAFRQLTRPFNILQEGV